MRALFPPSLRPIDLYAFVFVVFFDADTACRNRQAYFQHMRSSTTFDRRPLLTSGLDGHREPLSYRLHSSPIDTSPRRAIPFAGRACVSAVRLALVIVVIVERSAVARESNTHKGGVILSSCSSSLQAPLQQTPPARRVGRADKRTRVRVGAARAVPHHQKSYTKCNTPSDCPRRYAAPLKDDHQPATPELTCGPRDGSASGITNCQGRSPLRCSAA